MTERAPTYLDSLTALRGIAALWVVVFHFDAVVDPLLDRGATGLVTRGYLWVDFFFVLSGFIICHVYGDRFTGRPLREHFGTYLTARFSRVYPLHLFTLLLIGALWLAARTVAPTLQSSPAPGFFSLSTLPQNLALLHALGTTSSLSWNVPSWSIAAEWWTYVVAVLIFPLLHLRSGWRSWTAIGAALLGLLALERLHPRGSLDITWDWGFVRCLLGFTIGVGVYQLYRTGWGERILRRDAAFGAGVLATLALLHRTPSDVLLVPLFALLILAAARNDGAARRLLNTRPMRYLGDASYSIYMMQAFWLFIIWFVVIVRTGGPGPLGSPPLLRPVLLFGLVALVVASAGLTYRYVEVPARAWIRRTPLPVALPARLGRRVRPAGLLPATGKPTAEPEGGPDRTG